MTEAEVGVGEDKAAAEAALVAALEQVDGYLQLQGEAGTALRAGWLNIARARHAMGLHRVSSTMYSSTMKARTVVVTHSREAASSPVVHSEGAPDPMAAPESSQAASASVQEPASSSTAADSGTRQRAAATDANAPADSSGIEAGESSSTTQGGKALPALSVATAELSQQLDSMSLSTGDTAAAPSGDLVVDVGDISSCLRMFGGTPSPYLGAAQNEFVQAVRTLARVAAAQRELLSAVTALRQ